MNITVNGTELSFWPVAVYKTRMLADTGSKHGNSFSFLCLAFVFFFT